jgi:hypothetical protein
MTQAFPNYIPISSPEYKPESSNIIIHWVAGFTNANGCFFLLPRKDRKLRLGERVTYGISISQHLISLEVLEAIKSFFGFGIIVEGVGKVYSYRVDSLKNILKFINTFIEAQQLGAKGLDYHCFKQGIETVTRKGHLNSEGLNEIKALSKSMIKDRVNFDPFKY